MAAVALATVFGCTGTAEASAGATSPSQSLGGALPQFVMHPGLAEANACVDISSGPGRAIIDARAATPRRSAPASPLADIGDFKVTATLDDGCQIAGRFSVR